MQPAERTRVRCPLKSYASTKASEPLPVEQSSYQLIERSPWKKMLSKVASQFVRLAPATSCNIYESASGVLHSQHTQMARALQESEARCRAIFEAASVGIALVDTAGRILEVNAALKELFEYNEEELATRTVFDLAHPRDVVTLAGLHKELLAGDLDRAQLEMCYIRRDGQTMHAHLNASIVKCAEGQPLHILYMIENITEHRRVETELSEARHCLSWSREMERRHLAHELHDCAVQQLLGISYQLTESHLRVLQGSDARPVTSPTLATIRQEVLDVVKRLRELIGELLPSGLEEFGLAAALEGYVASLHRDPHVSMPKIDLLLSKRDMPLPESIVLCLFRIVQEAVRNALQHAQADTITIRLELSPEEAVLSVRDNGVGFQVPTHLSVLARANHFGLLGIVERVNWSHGRLTIDSEPNAGTHVKVHIPLKQKEDDE
jgi:PAS domain S-box-containing protein